MLAQKFEVAWTAFSDLSEDGKVRALAFGRDALASGWDAAVPKCAG